jgi:arylsulfatase
MWNISYNSRGMMGYKTPNIDRIAREGVSFTDYYGQQSYTAGRAAFIGGNVPLLFNLRRDPGERAQHNSNTYNDWFISRVFVIVPMQAMAATFLQTMQEYPPSQTPGSFNLTKIEEQLRKRAGSH